MACRRFILVTEHKPLLETASRRIQFGPNNNLVYFLPQFCCGQPPFVVRATVTSWKAVCSSILNLAGHRISLRKRSGRIIWYVKNLALKEEYCYGNTASLYTCIRFMGFVKMKCPARSYCWWPSMDKEIEDIGKRIQMCIQLQPEENHTISSRKLTNSAGDRVHTDHFWFKGAEFLVTADGYSKWIELFPDRTLTSWERLRILIQYQSRFNTISTLVDNGMAFSSEMFKKLCAKREIRHRTPREQLRMRLETVKATLSKLSSDPASQEKSAALLRKQFKIKPDQSCNFLNRSLGYEQKYRTDWKLPCMNAMPWD